MTAKAPAEVTEGEDTPDCSAETRVPLTHEHLTAPCICYPLHPPKASLIWEIPAGVHKAAPLCSLGQDPSSWALQGSRHRPWGSVRRGPGRFQKVPEASGGPLTGRSLAPQYHFRSGIGLH